MVFIPRPNTYLSAARKAKKDEWYTRLPDIERELDHYADQFHGKAIYLPCDDYRSSAFWTYFSERFESLGLTRLTATHYAPGGGVAHRADLTADGLTVTPLSGDGDFASEECAAIMRASDVVVTNPPFSLWRAFFAAVLASGADYLILGTINCLTYQSVWPEVQAGRCRLGVKSPSGVMHFRVPESYTNTVKLPGEPGRYLSLPSIVWLTSLTVPAKPGVELTASYDPDVYPTYDNYDAIEVSRVKDIPKDYYGAMGVPVTFLGKHNPDQFELLGNMDDHSLMKKLGVRPIGQDFIDGYRAHGGTGAQRAGGYWVGLRDPNRFPFKRIVIRRRA